MAIGDVKSDEVGSGARYNDGKPAFELIPLCTLEDEARVWEYGRRKYAAWNWAKGMPWSAPYGCLMRHLSAWQQGEELDPESGLSHLAHAACNLRMLTLYATTYPQGDDRPVKWMPKRGGKQDGEVRDERILRPAMDDRGWTVVGASFLGPIPGGGAAQKAADPQR